jgi:hypothetical protein
MKIGDQEIGGEGKCQASGFTFSDEDDDSSAD